MTGFRLHAVSLTDVGRARNHNEDQVGYQITDNGSLFVVCDGMGGHAAGEVASRIAIDTLLTDFFDRPVLFPDRQTTNPEATLTRAFRHANELIRAQAAHHTDQRGMGTTCVALAVLGDRYVTAHVGDSRAYLLRDNSLYRLTRDHSLVEEWVARGMINESQARHHPMGNVITRALGQGESVEVEIGEGQTAPDDVYLLCSDGLHGPVSDEQIAQILAAAPSLQDAAATLIAAANQAGGPDNITVAIARLERADAPVANGAKTRSAEEITAPMPHLRGHP